MNATESIADDMTADVQLVADCVATGIPVPPDAARRVHERAAQIRQRILKEQGVRDVGVQIIRELRGELPAP
jgi:hypothetical protein